MGDTSLVFDIVVGKNTLAKELQSISQQASKAMTTPGTDLTRAMIPSFRNMKGQFSEVTDKMRSAFDVGSIKSRLSGITGIMGQLTKAGKFKAMGVELEGVDEELKQIARDAGISSKAIDNIYNKGILSGTPKVAKKPKPEASAGQKDYTRTIEQLKQITFQTTKWDAILKQTENTGRQAALGFDVSGTKAKLKVLAKQAGIMGKQFERAFKQGSTSASRFDARMLSLLFGGMALKRAFGGILRSITTTFTKAEDETSGLTQGTRRLSAAWEFFKFSLFDALNNPFFLSLLDGIISVIDWFSQLGSGAKIAIISIVTGLALIGTGLMIIGQFSLGWNSIMKPGGFIANATTMLGPTGIAGIIAGVLLMAIVAGLAFAEMKEHPEETKKAYADMAAAVMLSLDNMKRDFDSVLTNMGLNINAMQLLGAIGGLVMGTLRIKVIEFSGSLEKLVAITTGLANAWIDLQQGEWGNSLNSLKGIGSELLNIEKRTQKLVSDQKKNVYSLFQGDKKDTDTSSKPEDLTPQFSTLTNNPFEIAFLSSNKLKEQLPLLQSTSDEVMTGMATTGTDILQPSLMGVKYTVKGWFNELGLLNSEASPELRKQSKQNVKSIDEEKKSIDKLVSSLKTLIKLQKEYSGSGSSSSSDRDNSSVSRG